MQRLSFAVFLMLFTLGVFGAYPYSTCPIGQWTLEGDNFQKVYDKNGNYLPNESYWADIYKFSQCNCTSYVAYKINEWADSHSPTNPLFCNSFSIFGDPETDRWGNAHQWKNAVGDRIPGVFSRYPLLPEVNEEEGINDWNSYPWKNVWKLSNHTISTVQIDHAIAWWDSSVGGTFGHVAWVESVAKDGKTVTVSEYNWDNRLFFGKRERSPSDSDYPDGFLYILTDELVECDLTGLCSNECTGDGGGGGNINPIPTDPVNLTQDTDILGADGNELYAGRDSILPGMKVKVRVAVQAEGGDAGNWKTRNDADTIDIAYSVSSNDGPWTQFDTGYITISKLDEGQTITETKEYTIPHGISSVAFRTEIDYRDEVEEYDEGDNTSRVERFEVSNLRPDLIPADVFLTSTSDGTRYISGTTLLEDQTWHPHCEIANLGEIASPIQTEVSHRMDGQERDTDSLGAGQPLPGSLTTEVVWSAWKLGDTGTRTYTCCVDSKNQLPELNEGNNCKSATYTVVPYKSDLIVSDLYLITSGGQVVRNGTSIPQHTTVHPYCVATNQGNRNVRNGTRLRYEVDAGNYRGDDGLDAADLKVGASKTEYMSDGFRLGDTGTRTYRCCVDYQGQESELNEGNNCATMSFTVYPTAPKITITDLWVDYDGKVVRNGGTGSKGKRYHPNVTFTNTGNKGMTCGAEAKYHINSNSYRDRDGIDNLGIGQSGHERVENDNIKLGDGGWRSYRVTVGSNCGEFPTVEATMSFYLK